MSEFIEIDSLLKVVVAGLIVGAGLPALFALGVRLAAGRTTPAAVDADGVHMTPSGEVVTVARPSTVRIIAAGVCFLVVVLAIAGGIVFLANGGH
ncbi:hypothetical protein [Cellulosimicrobium sp. Marseille-Q4280]|uniref:hypothetical protein n=1 Tax=Cellulosimicrobium sp. Marseille-Q4280 TaxID=2937992 RepID=UPI00203B1628|nr:hypothetical protein [Cellulosimicrobium sp. Marseille-Q4280]